MKNLLLPIGFAVLLIAACGRDDDADRPAGAPGSQTSTTITSPNQATPPPAAQPQPAQPGQPGTTDSTDPSASSSTGTTTTDDRN